MYGGVTGTAGDRLPMSIVRTSDFCSVEEYAAIHGSNVGKRLAWESTYSRRRYEAQDGLGLWRFVYPEIGLPSGGPR